MLKIVINYDYGGFGFNKKQWGFLLKMGMPEKLIQKINDSCYGDTLRLRMNHQLVQIVEKYPDMFGELRIKEVPDDAIRAGAVSINEYDGAEDVSVDWQKVALWKKNEEQRAILLTMGMTEKLIPTASSEPQLGDNGASKIKQKVVLHPDYGGFGLTEEQQALLKKEGMSEKLIKEINDSYYGDTLRLRMNDLLVRIVEQYPDMFEELCITEVSDDAVRAGAVLLNEYDGAEYLSVDWEKVALWKKNNENSNMIATLMDAITTGAFM